MKLVLEHMLPRKLRYAKVYLEAGSASVFFSLVGVVVAAGLLRWSAAPATWFVRTALTLTAISLVPPFLVGADAATVAALLGLHVVAASVMIPTVARCLRARED